MTATLTPADASILAARMYDVADRLLDREDATWHAADAETAECPLAAPCPRHAPHGPTRFVPHGTWPRIGDECWDAHTEILAAVDLDDLDAMAREAELTARELDLAADSEPPTPWPLVPLRDVSESERAMDRLASVLVETAERGDLGEWLSVGLAKAAARMGSVDALMARSRAGSWESAAVTQLVRGLIGPDDLGLEVWR